MLQATRLRRRFGGRLAVAHVDLAVPAGSLVGFVGPNGAGKTTTLRMIMGITAPDGGEIRLAGRRVDAAARRRFGYLPEQRGLYTRMRVRDHLVYLARVRGIDGRAAARGADRWLARLGLDGRAQDRVQDLSHGNQQRVQLAAALVHDPQVVLLDEPFSGLDPIGAAVLSDMLRELAGEGVGVLFSSHDLGLVQTLCSTVSIIEGGRTVATGTMDELAAGRPRCLAVEVAGTSTEWACGLPGVALLDARGSRLRLLLEPEGDPQSVLAAAIEAGPVAHFGIERPSLSDIFLDAVAGTEPAVTVTEVHR